MTESRFKADEYATKLESFKADIHFPLLTAPKDIQNILNDVSDFDKLRNLTSTNLCEYMVMLSTYSLYLAHEENRIVSYINWCESNIKYIVGRNLDSVEGYGFVEKDSKIRAGESHAVELEENKLLAQVKLDSIKFISQKLQYLNDTLKNLAYDKRKDTM